MILLLLIIINFLITIPNYNYHCCIGPMRFTNIRLYRMKYIHLQEPNYLQDLYQYNKT